MDKSRISLMLMGPPPEKREQPVDFDPFDGPEIGCTIPTTEAQREVFVAAQMGPEASCAYNESVSLELIGALDTARMETAIARLIERHEALRGCLSADGLKVVVLETVDIKPTVLDLSGKSATERQRELDAIAERDMTTPFDLRNGPVFRVLLIRLAPDLHLLRLTGHHVLVDGWSLGVLMADISRLYSGVRLEPAVRFSDFALAVIEHAGSEDHVRTERYWLDQFQGVLPRLDLPTDLPRPRVKTYNGRRLDIELDAELTRKLKDLATRSGAGFVTTLLTCFEMLLHQITGQTDLVVGLPAAGQNDFDMKQLVGHCVNLLALRSRIDEDRSFLEHLKERRRAVLDANDHQKYTFGTLVRRLNVPREPERIPLVPAVFNVDMNMDAGVAFDGLKHRFISNPRRYEHFELFLNATGNEEKLVLEWSYNTDLFREGTLRGWMDRFATLIGRITSHPDATVADLTGDAPLEGTGRMPPPEWLGTFNDYPKVDIPTLFEEVAGRYPDHVAVERLEERLTYRQLRERVRILSNTLVDLGVKPGDPVGVCMDRVMDLVAAKLAILRAGGCYVPLDPTYPAERLAFMFADSEVKVLFAQRHLLERLVPHQARLLLPDEITEAPDHPMPAIRPDAPAYIMYTSGSTGTPKGVVVPHRGIVRLVRDQSFVPFGPDLTWLQLSNVSFDLSTLEIWGALLNGGRCVLQPQLKPSLQEIVETIHRHQVTSVWFTTGLFNLLVDEHVEHLRGLRHILAGGDALSVTHVKKALRALGPGVLINGYGPTENTTFTTCWAINDEAAIGTSVPIGTPLHNTTVHVLDAHRNPVPVGHKGELWTGGDGVALGYWRRPELTAERFLDDPFRDTPGAKLYRTGDLARWLPDGTLQFIGRADGQVKIRGFRVELGEIENAVNDVPAVKDKVVVVRQGPGGDKVLTCYVVPREEGVAGDAAREDDLILAVREHLRAKLPAYMMPTAFAVIGTVPLTGNGKVDRKALPEPLARASVRKAKHVAPRNPVEQALAALWGKVLNAQGIGIHDNFFDLGGHSLIGIQLLGQVGQQFQRALPLKSLFEAPTIAQFAELLTGEAAVHEWRNLSLIQPEGSGLPLFCVHGSEASHFLPKHLGPTRPFYAFFHQGEDGRRIEHTTVEGIAAHFVREMKQARPQGPYLLTGYSFGGIVAFEMAQQLIALGDSVPLLVMLDTYSPGIHPEAMKLEWRFYQPVWKPLKRLMIRSFLRRGRRLPPFLRSFYIGDTYNQAMKEYHPRPFPGRITVFKSEYGWGPKDLGWRDLAGGGLNIEIVPGDHFSMIQEPQIERLSRILERVLADADTVQYFDPA
ncbi:MAG: amino acid adenylation domain-containing protein [Verrucomicrobiae bacterium]|nr:amino acid adenylation domain-containing protein [Verrucomicrobiae bacterium]